jgi:hypothetical protein
MLSYPGKLSSVQHSNFVLEHNIIYSNTGPSSRSIPTMELVDIFREPIVRIKGRFTLWASQFSYDICI